MATGKTSVTFSTKCWENDWEVLLRHGRLCDMVERCDYLFDKRIIIINNVHNRQKVDHYARRCVDQGVLDDYYFAEDYADEALKYFGVAKDNFGRGYNYSISEFVELFVTSTDYLVHFSSDAILEKKYDWITPALNLFADRDDITVINPSWDRKYDEVRNEGFKHYEHYVIGYGFSDQSYMVRTDELRKQIYNERNEQSERYPKYADELFEKRVDAYMRNHQRMRATLLDVSYLHRNWSFYRKLAYRLLRGG